MSTVLLPLRIAAVIAAGAALLCLAGCTPSPKDPQCYAISGATDAASQLCRSQRAKYERHENQSFLQKLVDGDRDSWGKAAPFIAVALGASGWLIKRARTAPASAPATPQPPPPPPPPPPPRKIGLAGSRIAHLGCIYTVLDDSAVTGDGRRSSVIAADEDDQAGLLFLGFDETGAVCEARTRDGAWAAAHVIG
ncbi:hypothetical protein MMAG44476_21837 [Mycolicibacterium mageritense DSM 44476 = CIP 104973]|jgi:hypothetical protein|uniref:Protease n=1 Tax=Mycolicibacterium canariasense TaxID=228230 RepID=A0A124E1V8_MYCCR|nr:MULTISPECIES: hypothetical protein [Mycolicibacterium]MCC9179550.1 hypothetical protein [Mycolicibacterium mageritense]MCV7211445.1 hypothetical protein [Mycolicibacterium canariasense]ORV10477.1 hypothetical protein AWB94_07200 [Mycolicibacterium canariasense]GAS94893.1 protease [Mycolicibacterium canariasense]